MDEQGIYVEIMKKLQRKYGSLNEIQKTTQEMQEALSRNDRVSMEMLISMRQEPTDKLARAQQALEQQRRSLPAGDAARLSAILKGAEAETAEEGPVTAQVGANQRVLKQLVDLDRVVNRKLAREKSFYQ